MDHALHLSFDGRYPSHCAWIGRTSDRGIAGNIRLCYRWRQQRRLLSSTGKADEIFAKSGSY